MSDVETMIHRFEDLIIKVSKVYKTNKLGPYIYTLTPDVPKKINSSSKPIALSFSALLHGPEVAGLGVFCSLLEVLADGRINLPFSVGMSLGNVEAAIRNVRFIDRDLNRSFGREQTDLLEDRRADELERLFNQTLYFVDYHQVKMPVPSPFWIFPFSRQGYQLARCIAADVPLVTHWGKGFSLDGQCSDEYINKIGGCGITMELGQNSFDPRQIAMGVHVALNAISAVDALLDGRSISDMRRTAAVGSIYPWAEIIPYPQTGAPVLDPGWSNFVAIKVGQRLGEFKGKEICAGHDGFLMFPKYPEFREDGRYGDIPPAAELVRILKPITEAELPAVL